MADTESGDFRTYTRRRGRITNAQERGLGLFAERYRADAADVNRAAGHSRIGIEVGFGMGDALLEWPQHWDGQLFGIELYQPGIGSVCDVLARQEITNVKVIDAPAQQVLQNLDDACIDEIRIFFPDPWPKKRHHKRRLIQPPFVADLARVLRPGGTLRLATDWSPYADWIRGCVAKVDSLVIELDQIRVAFQEAPAAVGREATRFESRGERLGHDIHDLVYRRSAT